MEDLFLSNISTITFLDKLKESLRRCDSFYFSVSFIKKAGLDLIEKEIEEALSRGAKGKIITSTYQNFTDISSLNTFLKWMEKYQNNFIVHLEFNSFADSGFHTKGYIFKYKEKEEVIIGSSNITRFALLKNFEWNVSLSSSSNFKTSYDALNEFELLFDNTPLLTKELIDKYAILLDYAIYRWDMDFIDNDLNVIKPNRMQKEALNELARYRGLNQNKTLIVAATGSGKTYLAALDAFNFDAKKLLFVVHRDNILLKAKNTFEKVFKNSRTYGLYTGKTQEIDKDFIFASNLMLSNNLNEFNKDEFDYIILDECHHASASTYQKIVNYFKPKFLLGMTATPDRMDNKDIYDIFDRNIPYELNLRDAILNDLVVPFHYYGIRDELINYASDDVNVISKEVSKEENIEFIIKEINKHKVDGKLKALAFCYSVEHAKRMAYLFNNFGVNAKALSAKDDLLERVKTFNELQDDNKSLEIICSVDILNEGIDIPGVNMVLFLRPTDSQTIFMQQLGRGLRKYKNKEYVVILDFIANDYRRSIHIVNALNSLSLNPVYEKAYLKTLIKNDFKDLNIPSILINIDELSKKEILNELEKKQDFNHKNNLIKDYYNFKNYIKAYPYPKHIDYLSNSYAPSLTRFMLTSINGSKNISYYSFLKKIGEENIPLFKEEEVNLINLISSYIPLVRVDEYLLIRNAITDKKDIKDLVNYNNKVTQESLNHAYNDLSTPYKRSEFKSYKINTILKDKTNLIVDYISDELKEYLLDLLEYGLTRYQIEFGDDFNDLFKLYHDYSKSNVFQLINSNKKYSKSNYMPGTFISDNGEDLFIFVTLIKDKDVSFSNDYQDKFISSKVFYRESENGITTYSNDGYKLIHAKNVYLFIRPKDEEDGIRINFKYFGKGKFIYYHDLSSIDKNNNSRQTIEFKIELDNEVDYRYLEEFNIKEEKYEES